MVVEGKTVRKNSTLSQRSNSFMTSHLKLLDSLSFSYSENSSKHFKKKESSINDATDVSQSDEVDGERKGDVIGQTGAVMTLSKAMFNTGCFSLPYAWKRGGLWVSFATSILICCFNWYGNHILVKSSQRLAKKSDDSGLDYGHFAKKVCENSEIQLLHKFKKPIMAFVNLTILFYQLGLCTVSILFISENMVNLCGEYLGTTQHEKMIIASTISLPFLIFVNLFTTMRLVTFFAMISAFFFAIGIIVILQFTVRQPFHLNELPASSDFLGTVTMFGIMMYSFEGQTMMLPVENKLRRPEDFLSKCGVLSMTMLICGVGMTAVGFFGYNGFGDKIAPTITNNVPKEGFYSLVNISLMIQTLLVHAFALYVIIEIFYAPFLRKFHERFPKVPTIFVDKAFRLFWVLLTYLMAVGIPHLEIMIPLVGVTSGTLCALVFPPLFEMSTFWDEWKRSMNVYQRVLKVAWNILCVCVGVLAIGAGIYTNVLAIIDTFSGVPVQMTNITKVE